MSKNFFLIFVCFLFSLSSLSFPAPNSTASTTDHENRFYDKEFNANLNLGLLTTSILSIIPGVFGMFLQGYRYKGDEKKGHIGDIVVGISMSLAVASSFAAWISSILAYKKYHNDGKTDTSSGFCDSGNFSKLNLGMLTTGAILTLATLITNAQGIGQLFLWAIPPVALTSWITAIVYKTCDH